jgi:Phage related hypothetical protein (DUF1799)
MDEASIANLSAALGRHAPDSDGIWPEHLPIVEAFLAISTQWRTVSVSGGMGPGRVLVAGLDYAAAQAGLQLAGITLDADQWTGVRIMEDAARTALNEANR